MTQQPAQPHVRIYVPRDSAARSVGADEVAAAIQQAADSADLAVDLVRTGSRGMLWLEPLVEVATERGRIGYGPVTPDDVPALLAAGLFDGDEHPCASARWTNCPGWPGRTGSLSRASASSIRSMPTTICATAVSPGCAPR